MNFLKKLLFGNKKVTPQPNDYILYYRKLCHDCDKVKSVLEKNKIAFNYLDCEEKDSAPPVPIFATPALFVKGELVAYGTDIIQFINKS